MTSLGAFPTSLDAGLALGMGSNEQTPQLTVNENYDILRREIIPQVPIVNNGGTVVIDIPASYLLIEDPVLVFDLTYTYNYTCSGNTGNDPQIQPAIALNPYLGVYDFLQDWQWRRATGEVIEESIDNFPYCLTTALTKNVADLSVLENRVGTCWLRTEELIAPEIAREPFISGKRWATTITQISPTQQQLTVHYEVPPPFAFPTKDRKSTRLNSSH